MVSSDTLDKLKIYEALLHKWQAKINLVSPTTLDDSWGRHFEDSMQVEKCLPENANILFDLGSGAGFAGLVLAIMRPDIDVSLVESDQKKCSFLKTVSRETGAKTTVVNERIEKFQNTVTPDVVTARALASLKKLFDYCEKWIIENPSITLIFLKGERVQEELNDISGTWEYDLRTCQSETQSEAKILIFSNISRL